jgi:hypothetical protein
MMADGSQIAKADKLKALAMALMGDGGSDWTAGIGALVREVEAIVPGFIQRIAARDTLERLGLPLARL